MTIRWKVTHAARALGRILLNDRFFHRVVAATGFTYGSAWLIISLFSKAAYPLYYGVSFFGAGLLSSALYWRAARRRQLPLDRARIEALDELVLQTAEYLVTMDELYQKTGSNKNAITSYHGRLWLEQRLEQGYPQSNQLQELGQQYSQAIEVTEQLFLAGLLVQLPQGNLSLPDYRVSESGIPAIAAERMRRTVATKTIGPRARLSALV